jgi:hypothetical protein
MSQNGTVVAARFGISRSSKWSKVEKEHLKNHPNCAACKEPGKPVQVHHKFPFHYCIALGRPDLELDERNLITLCESEKSVEDENHHLLIGHLDDFKSSNLEAEKDADITFHGWTKVVIMEDLNWLDKKSKRLKPLDEMTDDDKKEFTELMNTTFPKEN